MKARLKSRKSTILAGAAYSAGLISETAGGHIIVSNYTFAEGAGLYCIIGLDDGTLLEGLVKAVELLGLGGIGGRRSSGFGKLC